MTASPAAAALFNPALCVAGLEAGDAEAVIRALGERLTAAGLVRPGFVEAVLAREHVSPTGVPFAGRKAALPHADPEHVVSRGAAVATLRRPVEFRAMGDPATVLAVDVVVLLALPDVESAQVALVGLVERLQRTEFVDALCAAADAHSLYRLMTGEERP
ncbi:MAG TPA: PTS sugar transporter subunit IIA [Myxococcota bacterium]|nr:PTS sugar transporter subunit IIA [Myxococcota bacterium]